MRLKAAEGRDSLQILEVVLNNFVALDSEYKRLRLACLQNLVKIYEELAVWDDAASPGRVRDLARAHLVTYKELGVLSDTDEMLWTYAPKHHLFVHVIEMLRSNPKAEWCYADEDTIGKCADMATASNPLMISKQLINKYRATFEL